LFSVYGPGLEKQLIWDLITRLEQSPAEISAAGTGKESRDFVFVSDAVAMLAESATHADSTAPVFNGGSGHSTTVRELVSHLIELWPAKTSLKFSGIARPGDPKALVADMSKSAAIRPRELTPLRKGLQLTIDAARLRQRAK
jgi:UDP-glucose 4-epimerase